MDVGAASSLPARPGHRYSDIAAHDNAIIVMGDAHGVTINSKVATKTSFAGQYSSTSLRPVAKYVARPTLQQQMRWRLHETVAARKPVSKLLVVCGLGGAGKSQLVLHYIQTYRGDYSAVFWIDAGRKESVEQDYGQIYNLLFDVHHMAGKHATSVSDCIHAVKHWFHGRAERWLFVLDSADSIDAPEDSDFIDLQQYLPDAPSIDIIVTTRSQTARDMTELEAVQVGELTPVEARELFLRRANLAADVRCVTPEMLAEVDKIAEELGHFALAINLAAAYVAATPRLRADLRQYLVEYRVQRKVLLSRRPKRHVDQYGESVLSTWETSYAAIQSHCLEAAHLLTFLAFLSPDDIFLDLFDHSGTHTVKSDVPALVSTSSPEAWHGHILDESFEELTTYSLVHWKEEQCGYAMHKLVHTWGYERLGSREQVDVGRAAWDMLGRVASRLDMDPVMKLRLGPHIMTCFTRIRERWDAESASGVEITDMLKNLAAFLRETGQWVSEYELRLFEYEQLRQRGDVGSAAVLDSFSKLASVLWRQGKYEAAEEIHRRALEGREKELGKTHPNTLTSVSNLAVVLADQGKHEAAEKMNRRALEGREKELGKTHPDTLMSVSNLATVLVVQGKYEAAQETIQRALEGYEKELGKTHPSTLTSVDNLASVLGRQGKFDIAQEIYRRALEGREKELGKTHPDTLTSVSNLAVVLAAQGKYEAAEKMARRALEGMEKEQGKTHPNTLRTAWTLAYILNKTQRSNDAFPLYERAAAGLRMSLGEEHPDTVDCEGELTELRQAMNVAMPHEFGLGAAQTTEPAQARFANSMSE